jgi:hypothetical protein
VIKFILFLVMAYFLVRFILSLFGMNIARMAAREAVKDAFEKQQRNAQQSGGFYQRSASSAKSAPAQVEDIDYEEIQ